MVLLILPNPSEVRLLGYENRLAEVDEELTYIDKSIDYEIRQFSKNRWYKQKYGEAAYAERLKELKDQRNKSLLFRDEQGLWTYSGLKDRLASNFDDTIEVQFIRPSAKAIPWAKIPEKTLRYYQQLAHDRLLEVGHGAVEIGTGLGKSFIILNLCKSLGLKTVIMSPSLNIAEQLYDEFVLHFGKRYVGFFGDGKKQSDRLFTIGIGASLTKVEPGSPAYKDLSQAQVFIADESHMCPAKTLTEVCFGVVKSAPYRFFFSGTQMRGDGKDLLLNAITGPIVFRMSVREGVDQGFLAKPVFRMIRLHSGVFSKPTDVNRLTRAHLFYSEKVNAVAADLANKAVSLMGRPTVILVEEIEQFTTLLPYLRYETRFAHGPLNKEQKKLLPAQYQASNPKELVEQFNRGEFQILVGTSCITTGTDIQAVQCLLFMRGGKSEVEVKQAVGRGTRLFPGKTDCIVMDFCIENDDTLTRHAEARRGYYEDIYPSYQEIRV